MQTTIKVYPHFPLNYTTYAELFVMIIIYYYIKFSVNFNSLMSLYTAQEIIARVCHVC